MTAYHPLTVPLIRAHEELDDIINDIRKTKCTQNEAMDKFLHFLGQQRIAGYLRVKDLHTLEVKFYLFTRSVLRLTVHGFWHNGQFYATKGDHPRYYQTHGISPELATTLIGINPSGLFWNAPNYPEW